MARPLRVQLPGGVYHVMSRGNARERVFFDDIDRQEFLARMCRVATRLEWQVMAYCLMANHYHLLVETREATLVRGMRDINGGHAQAFNRRHGRVGHVFQGRYKALVVERGTYLLELVRYIVRNPVKAGLCASPAEWPWSSHRATVGLSPGLPCVSVHGVLAQFASDSTISRRLYARFVANEALVEHELPDNPVIAGSQSFVTDVVSRSACVSPEIPRKQRAIRSLRQYQQEAGTRDLAITLAYASGWYSLADIARHFGLHYSTVSRICRRSTQVDAMGGRSELT